MLKDSADVPHPAERMFPLLGVPKVITKSLLAQTFSGFLENTYSY